MQSRASSFTSSRFFCQKNETKRFRSINKVNHAEGLFLAAFLRIGIICIIRLYERKRWKTISKSGEFSKLLDPFRARTSSRDDAKRQLWSEFFYNIKKKEEKQEEYSQVLCEV